MWVMKKQKVIKSHSLVYLTPAQYDSYSAMRETNSERIIASILTSMSGTDIEILPVIPANSKMIFLWDYTPLRKVVLQDA